MKKVNLRNILKIARKLSKENKPWHFHILLPGCKLNKDKKYALILEDTGKKAEYIHLSLRKPLKTGKKLVDMLHGEGISENKNKKVNQKVTSGIKKMIEKAKELNVKGFAWHHHLLFPDCVFNKDPRYWTLMFEDTLNGEIFEEKSSSEPVAALSQIEPLYYSQK